MERTLDELLVVCERAHSEEKSGTRERSILSLTTKTLRKCLHEPTGESPARKEASVEPAAAAAASHLTSSDGSGGGTAPPPDPNPRRRLLSSADAVNRLAYASRIALVGDKTVPPEKAGGGGSVPRGSAKALVSSLELAAVLLNSGVIPTALHVPLPFFDIAQNASGGAHAFFTKILGGGGGSAKAGGKGVPGGGAPAAGGTEATGPDAGQNGASVAENVRDGLVDAVIAASPMIWSKDATDKLLFVFITALQAATVPRVSRTSVEQLGDNPDELRFSALSLHGPRLIRVMHVLFNLLTRPGTSLVLLDEVRNVLHQVVKALAKHTEVEIWATPLLPAGSEGGESVAQEPSSSGEERPGRDLVSVLDFCAAVCRVAPLTASSTNQSSSPGPAERRTTVDDIAASVVSEASVAPLATYSTLVTSLGFILHIIVNGGHMFRRVDSVIQCIRLNIVPTAVRTALSNETDVFRLSLNVLLTCCVTFGPHLVNETSTVFRHVFFRVLESKYTSFDYKSMVIEAFRTYIEEPQNLIGLFLNYDCNTRSQSIYEEMINYLAALAQVPLRDAKGKQSGGGGPVGSPTAFADPSDSTVAVSLEYEVPEGLRRKAMQTLLLVAESNIQWIERFETDQSDSEDAAAAQRGVTPAASPTTTTTTTTVTTNGEHDAACGTSPHPATKEAAVDISDAAGEDQTETTGSSAQPPAAGRNDTFLHARRYKDALKKFFYLFNEKGDPEGAIDYVKNCVLILGAEMTGNGADVAESTRRNAPAPPPPSTSAPAPAAAEGERTGEGDAAAKEDETVAAADAADAADAGGAAAASSASGTRTEGGVAVPASTDAEVAEAARVARFLFDHEDWVDKIVLGEYFAKSFRKMENRLVFEQWIELYDFSGLKLDEALRLFLGGFKLLGEAQIVDRTMELFAAQYCRQNPTVFTSADTAFILSFSICMLNTDAHSSHIKNKMTVEGFIRNNKGIDEGNDVDPSILTGIYNRIVGEEVVLRPSKYVSHHATAAADSKGSSAMSSSDGRGKGGDRFSGGVLDSIPLLRHFAPIANAITDKVLLPMDAVSNTLFGGAQRKREEMYQEELRAALRDVTEALRSSATMPLSAFVTATSIQNALPMWEVTVDLLCRRLASSLFRIFEESESYISPSITSQSAGAQSPPPDYDPVQAYMRETKSYEYFQILLRGLTNTVHVCCSFGNVTHSETLLEQAFQMTQLSQTVIMSNTPASGLQVQVVRVIPRTRLELLVEFLNLYLSHGASFGSRGWQVGYTAMSLVDALANGIEGLWKRQTKRLLQRVESGVGVSPSLSPAPAGATPPATGSTSQVTACSPAYGQSPATPVPGAAASAVPTATGDVWFGVLNDVPTSVAPECRKRRENVLNTIRAIRGSVVDLWLERLFDATQFPTTTQLQMANSLVKVSQKELQHSRTFTLTKLFDFVTVCASFSTRLQWRELWANASAVFVQAGRMDKEIASQALDGLRIIAMTYLMREELLNYSFQKEVLKPFEEILMANQDIFVRRRVINIMSELIDFRAGHLASGWHVVFTCLSHAAVIPEVVGLAWEVCERVMAVHVDHMKDCFSDLIFCLTSFACTSVDEQVPLRGISYLVACGHWLQYGLEAPPAEVREAADVVRWACRFRDADVEARASLTLGKNFVRVTQAGEPLTQLDPLVKPQSFAVKTHYHLWISLFEGLIPIVVVHTSTRVRAHAVCSICALLRQYGNVFSVEVQDSLFNGTLRPVLATLISHVEVTGDAVVDRIDYRMLVYLALRGLVLACSSCAHLLELCCDTLTHLSRHLGWGVDTVENDLVDVWVRVCCDMLAAVVTSAASSGARAGGDKPNAQRTREGSESFARMGGSTPLLSATRSSSFALRDLSQHGSFSVDPSGVGIASLAWLPPPLPEKKDANPFFLGLLHEVQQMGAVDVVHYKRTASWTELHIATAVTTATITLAQPLQTFSLTSLVQRTVLQCLGDGLLAGLSEAVVTTHRDNRDLCLVFARAIRHAMLGVGFYCVATHDMEGVVRLLDAVHPFSLPTMRLPALQQRQQQQQRGSSAIRRTSEDGDKSATVRDQKEVDTPIELLLSLPYVTVLLEFIFSFPIDSASVGHQMLKEHVTSFLAGLSSSRMFCVEQQLEVHHAFQLQAAEQGTLFKPYKGRNFIDIFRCGRGEVKDRDRYYTPDTAPQLRRRKFHEWKYLTSLLAVHCTFSLGTASLLGVCADTSHLFQLLAVLPSELEEAVAGSFLRSCWRELDLHCNMPDESTMASCLALLQARLRPETKAEQ